MPSNAYPPLFANTKNDQGAPPVVLGYIGASITVLVSLIRVGLTLKKQHDLRRDDYLFIAGAVWSSSPLHKKRYTNRTKLLAVVTSILLERAVDEGLGRHAATLMHSQLEAYTRLTYATGLLGIVSQAAAKVSVAFLYERLAPRQDKKGITILLSAIGFWVVFAFIGTAFSCGVQVDWDASCSAGSWVEFVVIALNFVTDLMLAVWMVPRIWKLQARTKDRVLPIMLMGSRVLVCALQIGQLGVLGHLRVNHPFHSNDDTWTEVTYWTITISIVHLSIITATIPRINSFIADIQTRQAGLALTRSGYDSYVKSGSNGHASKDGGSRNWTRSKKQDSRGVLHSFRPDATAEQHNNCTGRGDEIEMDVRDNVETGSQSSLNRNVVYQKTDFHWEEEYMGRSKY
ncbi:uncharacterized protein LTR77_002390 [Saxophila tyrrhenica]|uniref:Rhodopsin domain-containing protein n=1 Tax=Saxophila tyrrhenica TaxID=1690608 RepID=A0AAV9PJC5_9PEZI|nr:hypothetical protein LTR77_002390 [Saxophila tyrrhenica]